MKKQFIVTVETTGPGPVARAISNALVGGLEDEPYWRNRLIAVSARAISIGPKDNSHD